MPASIGPFLWLCSALLLPQGGSDFGPRFNARSTSRHPTPTAIVYHPKVTIEAMPQGLGWPWRISEANTTEEESSDGDDLGPWKEGDSRGRVSGDLSASPPIRPDRGNSRHPFRSSILRC